MTDLINGTVSLENAVVRISGEFTLRRDLRDWIGTRPERPPNCRLTDARGEHIGWCDLRLVENGVALDMHLLGSEAVPATEKKEAPDGN